MQKVQNIIMQNSDVHTEEGSEFNPLRIERKFQIKIS